MEEAILIEDMLNGEDLTPDRSEAGLLNRESNEDIPASSTRSVLSQALVNIFNNHLEMNLKKTIGKSLPVTFIGDTKLSRVVKRMRLIVTSQMLSI